MKADYDTGPQTGLGPSHYFSTSVAREKISQIILLAQERRAKVILTRHGKPVAAVVSLKELRRIEAQQDVEDKERELTRLSRWFGPSRLGVRTPEEAGAKVQKMQLDRLAEREVLRQAGLRPIEGGELEQEVEVKTRRRRRWWQIFTRR